MPLLAAAIALTVAGFVGGRLVRGREARRAAALAHAKGLRHVPGDPFALAGRLGPALPEVGAAGVRVRRTLYAPTSSPLRGLAVAEWTAGATGPTRRHRAIVRFAGE